MAIEIERKFLIRSPAWRDQVSGSVSMMQGYLLSGERSAIRVRIEGESAHLNIKHALDGIRRLEYEYPIPLDDAREILARVAVRPLIEKTRHYVTHAGMRWEIDEFHGANAGLLIAEIELTDPLQVCALPDWLGDEVSDDVRYYNSNLSRLPYSQW